MGKLKRNVVYISKLDAAKRQLDFSIKLFFLSGDMVALHTITAAAHQILDDLVKKKKSIGGFMFNYEAIRQDKVKEVRDKMREAQNFFKHADRKNNEQDIIDFNPELTEFFIMDACEMYKSLVREIVPLHFLYDIWFSSKHPNFLLDEKYRQSVEKILNQIPFKNKAGYFALLPEIESLLLK